MPPMLLIRPMACERYRHIGAGRSSPSAEPVRLGSGWIQPKRDHLPPLEPSVERRAIILGLDIEPLRPSLVEDPSTSLVPSPQPRALGATIIVVITQFNSPSVST